MPDGEPPWPRRGYAWYVVAVLSLVYAIAFVDRYILALLVAPIRRDLEISDTKLSLVMGASFAIFYTLFGIPLGALVDRGGRRNLIAAGLALWSLMTGVSAWARRFFDLLVFRVGVGVGEAALSPAAYSIIADYFPPQQRGTAISVYSMGIYVGSGLAFVAGGVVVGFASGQEWLVLPLLGAMRPWQVVFLVVGCAGLLALPLLASVREPARRTVRGHIETSATGAGAAATDSVATGAPAAAVPPREALVWLSAHRATFACHNLGFALLALAGYANNVWVPTFLARHYDWSIARIGIVYGLIVACCGTLGVVCGGRLADHWVRRGRPDGPLRVGILGCLACLPFTLLYPHMPSAALAAALIAPTVFFVALPFGVAPAAIQEIVPSRLRGQASALYLFVINLVGLGLGPTAVALLTDRVFHDDRAVNLSLLIVGALAQAGAALLLWAGLRPYRRSWEALRNDNLSP